MMASCLCHLPAPSAPTSPLSPFDSVWPSAHAEYLAQNSLLELLDWTNSCLYFKTMLSFPTTQSSRPGHGVGPAAAHVLGCQRQAASTAAVKTGSWQQPGMIHGEWKDKKAWVSPCIRSLRVTQKCLGFGRGDPSLTHLSFPAWDLEGVLQTLAEISWRLRLQSLEVEQQGRF